MSRAQTLPDYRNIYSRDWRNYLSSEIQPAESIFLDHLRGQWHRMRFLDLGVGAGRTAWIFSPLVESYVGVDIVPEMIQHCLETFPPSPRREFLVGDAQDLSRFASESFDAVLFSYNGLDHATPEGRAQTLSEIHRVLNPGGTFFFSSHSLTIFPYDPRGVWFSGRALWRWPRQVLNQWRLRTRFAGLNAKVNSEAVRVRGWAVLEDGTHSGDMAVYYCYPSAQKKQLESLGFAVDRIFTDKGKSLSDVSRPPPSWWNYYLCRKPREA